MSKQVLEQPALRRVLRQWLKDTRRTALVARLCAAQSPARGVQSTWAIESLAIAEAFEAACTVVCERLGISDDQEADDD